MVVPSWVPPLLELQPVFIFIVSNASTHSGLKTKTVSFSKSCFIGCTIFENPFIKRLQN
ncbi:hypothetical protein HanRHA438_Chr07g0294771 [Helianthus annuus]|nr:hypothetical protein HanRHA438_Chr07g0294771 [Helianthus annuus]